MPLTTRLRLDGRLRAAVQTVVILALVVVAWQVSRLSHSAEDSEKTVTAVNGILARSCGAASFAELRQRGLVEECRLAQQGVLPEKIPDSALPSAGADPEDVDPDVVKDDDTSTPADTSLVPIDVDSAVAEHVRAYFESHPITAQPGYARAIQRAVGVYLTVHPPEPGRPPTGAEIRSAVKVALLANPPKDGVNGEPGANGRGVASAAVDGCDVVFTYSDGTTDRVGPLCGKDGSDGKDGKDVTSEQVQQAVAAYCSANGDCRGPAGPPGIVTASDGCTPAEGEYVTDVALTYADDTQTITLTCTTAPIVPGLGNGR